MPLESRPFPEKTFDGLFPPQASYPYFAHSDRFPFEPLATDYSAINAWWLADACYLIYGNAPFIEDTVRQSPLVSQGFDVGWLGTADNNRGMVLSSAEALVVVFRGTRLQVHTLMDAAEVILINQDDLWTDSQFLPASSLVGGRVHSGFLSAFAEISDQLDAIVQARQPGQAIWLTGHSLGGALATLAAAHLGSEVVRGLYTYGCPRVGDPAFARTLPERSYYRFVHREDWVPLVPPKMLGYVHAGTQSPVHGSPPREFWEDLAADTKASASALIAWVKELRLKFGDLPIQLPGIVDHAPVYYSTLLWNALVAEAPDAK